MAYIRAKINTIETNRTRIAELALERESENDAFREFIARKDSQQTDVLVHELNDKVSAVVDCTQCGACCRQLMINVTDTDAERMASALQKPAEQFTNEYLEVSLQGHKIMNSIPCAFLQENHCTRYEHRFTECREFPHLHRKNFKDRMFGTLIHYAMCPIIFNVLEELKFATGFKSK